AMADFRPATFPVALVGAFPSRPSRSGALVHPPGSTPAPARGDSIPSGQQIVDARTSRMSSGRKEHGRALRRTRHLVMRKIKLALSVALLAAIVIPATASATWPVASHSSYISQRASRHHPAIDIAAHKGTRVIPIAT